MARMIYLYDIQYCTEEKKKILNRIELLFFSLHLPTRSRVPDIDSRNEYLRIFKKKLYVLVHT